MDNEVEDLEQQRVETALTHAGEARKWLEQSAAGLTSAGRWGVFDFLGGGWFSSSRKHGHLDRVRSQLRRARRALQKFGDDCEELGLGERQLGSGLSLTNNKWERGIDMWLDNPFTDAKVQKRIMTMQREVASTLKRLEVVSQKLREMRSKVE